jgi:hypothetical protein
MQGNKIQAASALHCLVVLKDIVAHEVYPHIRVPLSRNVNSVVRRQTVTCRPARCSNGAAAQQVCA